MLRHFAMRAAGRWLMAAMLCTSTTACGVKGPLVPAPKPASTTSATPATPAATAPVDKAAPEPTTPNPARIP